MKDGKPNVLLLIPNLGSGGAQRVFHQHRQFLSRDFNVTSCVFNFDEAFPEEAKDNIISLEVPAGRNIIEKISCFFRRVKKVKKLKRDHHIHITISHLEGADYVNILSKQKDKLILWIHGTKRHDKEIKGAIGWFRRNLMLSWLYRRADKIGCVSDGIAEELKSIIPRHSEIISVVRNGIDIDSIKGKSQEPLSPEWMSVLSDHFVIVTHCRFAPQKNLRALIRIAAALKDVDRVRFVLIGDGEQHKELTELSKQLNVSVFFTGQLMNPFPFLRNSSLYILTSLWEGFPLSLCEAIACRLPIVAADCPTGPGEILNASSAGKLMPMVFENSESSILTWTTELRNIIRDQPLLQHYRDNAARNAHLFSQEGTGQQTIDLIRSVLS